MSRQFNLGDQVSVVGEAPDAKYFFLVVSEEVNSDHKYSRVYLRDG